MPVHVPQGQKKFKEQQRCAWQRALLATHLLYCVLAPLPVMDGDKWNCADYQRHAKRRREENETEDEREVHAEFCWFIALLPLYSHQVVCAAQEMKENRCSRGLTKVAAKEG